MRTVHHSLYLTVWRNYRYGQHLECAGFSTTRFSYGKRIIFVVVGCICIDKCNVCLLFFRNFAKSYTRRLTKWMRTDMMLMPKSQKDRRR